MDNYLLLVFLLSLGLLIGLIVVIIFVAALLAVQDR
jgi:hypothetical protein